MVFIFLLLLSVVLIIHPNPTSSKFSLFSREAPESLLPEERYFLPLFLKDQEEKLKASFVDIDQKDYTAFFPSPDFPLGGILQVRRATPVYLIDGKEKRLVKTFKRTVNELLAEEEIVLSSLDQISEEINRPLFPYLEIQITRIKIEEKVEITPIDFSKKEILDPNLLKGEKRLIKKGRKGKRKKEYLLTYKNGELQKKELILEEEILKPEDEIIHIGTKEVILGEGIATWYQGIGKLSAASNIFPFGERVEVINLENGKRVTVTIKDRGIKGEAIIDLSSDAFLKIAPLSLGKVRVRVIKG